MAKMTKTAMERIGKRAEMERIIDALTAAGIPIERVIDAGTLAYMITDGDLEGRFITLKVVLTKEYNEETGTGFDMEEAMREYELKMAAEAERIAKSKAKEAEKEAKAKAKAEKLAKAKEKAKEKAE
jgi:hypothetical protein